MSDMIATVSETSSGFLVEGYERISHGFSFLDGIFRLQNPHLADMYRAWNRCFAVVDVNVYGLYGAEMENYFENFGIALAVYKCRIGEKAKTMETLLQICDAMNEFGLIRKEPVLVVGGGLVTDVAGFACAMYRRNSNYIRIPTTLIGLIDASVSIKVAVNHGSHKNRLGAYHAPLHTFLDFTFLRTLPRAQIRNGFAELIKISTCADLRTFELLDKYCEKLIETCFGRLDGSSEEVIEAADEINKRGIHVMLQLESPNLHEIGLDRVIAYGHTWSPTLELAPTTPFRHGHAISIDMAYSATLALQKGLLGSVAHDRILRLFSRAGLSIDHDMFTESILEKGTEAILRTRDGKLRAAIPAPLGSCIFLNDYTLEELFRALNTHKELCKKFPRRGLGLDVHVDASDTGIDAEDGILTPNGEANLKTNASINTVDNASGSECGCGH